MPGAVDGPAPRDGGRREGRQMAGRMTAQQILDRLGGEAFVGRLIGAIETVGLATDETGQKGTVTLKVESFKEKGSEKRDGYVGYKTRLVTVPPSPSVRATGLYVDEDGLHVDDPRQTQMELRAVEQGTPETRDVPVGHPQARRV